MSDTTTVITPHLCCRNAAEAVEFYRKAFGATVNVLHRLPSGFVMHASLDIDGATVYLAEEAPDYGAVSPLTLGNSPVVIHLRVPDADAVFQRAVDAGCEVRMPLSDMFWGDRYGVIADPYGHKWSIATTVREVAPEEIAQAMAGMPGV